MVTAPTLKIREASPDEDAVIAHHFYQMWRANNVPERLIHSDWLEITFQFIAYARQELFYQAFVAEVAGVVVGSASCQLFAGLYPQVLAQEYRKYGYIWGVYVEPRDRKRGIAQQLTQKAIAYLKSLDCTRVILHASPSGKPVYSGLEFSTSNEMQLNLKEIS